jgi:predicted amidohydrolase YtcJ
VSVLVDSNQVVWIRPSDAEEEIGPAVEIVDSSGATIVPGLVHCHSHLTLPGGAHWLDHTRDSSWWVSIALTYRSLVESQALVRLHQRRIPDHVGEHHRDEPTIEHLTHGCSLDPPRTDGNGGTR